MLLLCEPLTDWSFSPLLRPRVLIELDRDVGVLIDVGVGIRLAVRRRGRGPPYSANAFPASGIATRPAVATTIAILRLYDLYIGNPPDDGWVGTSVSPELDPRDVHLALTQDQEFVYIRQIRPLW